ncbi:hypothetical protein BDR26DRAFT_868339 [Obelidium mucronatum]|nr:hypothetical protein BDR26DRAFT_868339 [Obelidium mucronatum]
MTFRSVLVILDSSANARTTIQGAMHHLAGTGQDEITVVSIVKAASQQSCTLKTLTTILKDVAESKSSTLRTVSHSSHNNCSNNSTSSAPSQTTPPPRLIHPSTQFRVIAVPETICQFENTMYKIAKQARPEILLLGVQPLYSMIAYSMVYRSRCGVILLDLESAGQKPQIAVPASVSAATATTAAATAVIAIVPDENEDYYIKGSPRCESPF